MNIISGFISVYFKINLTLNLNCSCVVSYYFNICVINLILHASSGNINPSKIQARVSASIALFCSFDVCQFSRNTVSFRSSTNKYFLCDLRDSHKKTILRRLLLSFVFRVYFRLS